SLGRSEDQVRRSPALRLARPQHLSQPVPHRRHHRPPAGAGGALRAAPGGVDRESLGVMTDTATPNSITFQIETEDGILTAEVAMDAVDTFDLRETMLMTALVGAIASG